MAKKLSSSPAFVFEFAGPALQRVLASSPDKVVFTVSVEAVEAKGGGKVGALRIKAKGVKSARRSAARATSALALVGGDGSASGIPKPPGVN